MQAILKDWGLELGVTILTDSSAALGTANRRGLGKLRHVQTRFLWLQERIAEGDLKIVKIGTDKNVRDLCTKPLSRNRMDYLMQLLGYEFRSGTTQKQKALIQS